MSSLSEHLKGMYKELMSEQDNAQGEFYAVSTEKTSFRINQNGRTETIEELEDPLLEED